MQQTRKIGGGTYWLGGSDRRAPLFENVFPVPNGMSYNAYFVADEKTVLLDTVDKSVSGAFFENLAYLLGGRTLDYVIINHMEPDHCAGLPELVARYPDVKIVGNAKTFAIMKQFFDFDADARAVVVKDGDTLDTGAHKFTFFTAPMVHWPETMVTYDASEKALYSADAFGTFGALCGNLYADEYDFEKDYLPEARRYYANIVGKYGAQTLALLKKAAALDIRSIRPLHGPIWRENLDKIIAKYALWGAYEPEEAGVVIAYSSIYGGTENAVNVLAGLLSDAGVKNLAVYDVSSVHPSVIVAEAFRCGHLVFAAATYNAGIFCNSETVLRALAAHNVQNRTVALIENGSWAPAAASLAKEIFASMKNIRILQPQLSIKSAPKNDRRAELEALADAIAGSVPKPAAPDPGAVDTAAVFKLSYGLFVLSAANAEKASGCIVNTVAQLTSTPLRVSVTVNKANYTHGVICGTGLFCASVLTESAPFGLFEHFGFQSGKTVDKFGGNAPSKLARTPEGLPYLTEFANAYIAGRVVESHDLGTHTEFVADVIRAGVLSAEKSATYQYYFDNIKPKPAAKPSAAKKYVCKICGYTYGDTAPPPDFVCPVCKHPASDFEAR
jgi:flavorubredoxin/flavin reductase (DIM6/NTAB) family NADH-FMN oxidoreductase RutF